MSVNGAPTIVATEADHNRRLDAVVAAQLPDCSRSLAANLIAGRHILVNNESKKPGYRVKAGDEISVQFPEPEPVEFEPEPIPLQILYQDSHIAVINKQAGLVVHPAPGHSSGTLVNALLYHCPDLEGIGGEVRPGIVHRLDKDTSGTMVIAKNSAALDSLAKQFKNRSVEKKYLALVYGKFEKKRDTIDLPIGRHPVHRKQMSTITRKGRNAVTSWEVLREFPGITLLELILQTGRTHQIRVHCATIDHPIIGDPTYGPRKLLKKLHSRTASLPGEIIDHLKTISRQMLHAWKLEFNHPGTNERMSFESPLPEDMAGFLAKLEEI